MTQNNKILEISGKCLDVSGNNSEIAAFFRSLLTVCELAPCMLVSETGRACEQQTVVMKSYKPLRHIRSFIINFIHFSIEIVFSDASHSVTLFESGLILLQFRPFTA